MFSPFAQAKPGDRAGQDQRRGEEAPRSLSSGQKGGDDIADLKAQLASMQAKLEKLSRDRE